MAVRFGKLFGNGARFRANMQRVFDLAIAERNVDVSWIPTLTAAVDCSGWCFGKIRLKHRYGLSNVSCRAAKMSALPFLLK